MRVREFRFENRNSNLICFEIGFQFLGDSQSKSCTHKEQARFALLDLCFFDDYLGAQQLRLGS